MTDPRGLLVLTAGGREWRLWMGMSVIAELQARHGQDVLQRLDAPEGAAGNWMPDLGIVVDLVVGCLQRYHADEADRFIADEIIAENSDALPMLLQTAFPDQEAKPGNRKARRAAAAST